MLNFNDSWYDVLVSRSNEKELIISEIKKNIIGQDYNSCLEIGTGTKPIFYNSLKDFFEKYIAIEKKLTNSIKESGLKVIEGDWEKAKIQDVFDVIICSHCFYYFVEKKKSVEKMIRSLSDNGVIFFIVNGNEKDYAKVKLYFSDLIGKEYKSTHSELLELLKSIEDIKINETSITSRISYKDTDELYDSLRLSFDVYPLEYNNHSDSIKSFLNKEVSGDFEIEQKIIMIRKNG